MVEVILSRGCLADFRPHMARVVCPPGMAAILILVVVQVPEIREEDEIGYGRSMVVC